MVERAQRTALEEFWATAADLKGTSLANDSAERQTFFNRERPHLGYRNQGRRPRETVERFVSQSPARQGG